MVGEGREGRLASWRSRLETRERRGWSSWGRERKRRKDQAEAADMM
jgi:hypothetical protein